MGVNERSIPLRALSDRQKRIVQRHIPLVYLSLERMDIPAVHRRRQFDPRDLVQEGFVTLVEAFRSHDAARHGNFAPYAMSRVQYSISRYLHESAYAVRVPFITQRRRKCDRIAAEARRRPDEPPRQVSWSDQIERWGRDKRNPDPDSHGSNPAPTLGDLIRDRCDAAMDDAVRKMRQSPHCSPGRLQIIDRCQKNRWTIPEPEMQSPIRRVAADTGTSLAGVVRCEEKFRRHVADHLRNDPVFQRLMKDARRRRRGLKHRPD
ncbi:MAG TPA: sigma factor [Phycisphaerae bacterium]|nr:sigma factor [Phycisphaerae bacterium]